MARPKATLQELLIREGVDYSAPEFQREMNSHIQAAVESVPPPKNPLNENVPKWFEERSRSMLAFGRLGVMLQVILISGGIGPVINLGLIVADTVRIFHVISFFEHQWSIAALLSVVTIFSYTYLAVTKAELKYLLRKNEREQFSLRRWRENAAYWLGVGENWTPRKVSQAELEYRRIGRFYSWFKIGIFVLLAMASTVTVIDDMQRQPDDMPQHITGAVGGVVITMILLSALDLQVDRSYKAYMQTDGGQQQSLDFFALELERYAELRRVAGEQAREAYLKLQLRKAQEQRKLLAAAQPQVVTIEQPTFSTNGHHKPEQTVN